MSFNKLTEIFFAWMHRQSLQKRYTVVAVIMVIWSFLDWLTGYEFNFSFFYLIPISMTAWFISIEFGYAMCIISGMIWGVLNLGEHQWHSMFFPLWNMTMRMLFFFVTTKLLGMVHRAFETERLVSRTDYLTGALNSRSSYEQLESELERYKRYDHEFVLAYIDLDNFKKVNDTKGHSEGDLVLKTTTKMMKETLRRTDMIGRMGGDEFIVIMPHIGLPGARVALHKMEKALLKEMAAHDWPVTFSIGVITPKPAHDTVQDMIRAVDALMYEVKGKGKNAILFEAS